MWKRKQNEGKVLKIMYKNLRVSGNDELPLFLFPVMEEVEKIFKGVSEEALGWSTAVSLACIGGVRLAEVRGPGSGAHPPYAITPRAGSTQGARTVGTASIICPHPTRRSEPP